MSTNSDSYIDTKFLLPSEDQEVAFLVKYPSHPFGGYFRDGNFYGTLDDWYFEKEEITHWYPLPKRLIEEEIEETFEKLKNGEKQC